MPGTLYLCATPIGNLQDISLRALETLKSVPLIAAEDTRHTRKLLNYYDIKTPLTSYHQHNEQTKALELINHLKLGKDLALVTDAGLPGISDPGEILVQRAIAEAVPVDVIPGPTAFVSGAVISGLPTAPLYFAGFLPSAAKDRRKALSEVKDVAATRIFYEAPHRLEKFLEDVLELYGDVQIVVAREITKLHQEVLRAQVSDIIDKLRKSPLKGEIVVLIGPPEKTKLEKPTDWRKEVLRLLDLGMDKKQAIKELAQTYKVPKREIYNFLIKQDQNTN